LWTTNCPLFQAAVYHPPAVFCLSSLCLLKVPSEINSLLLPPSPVRLQHPDPSAICLFSVPCLFWFFWGGQGISLPRGLCWFIPGVGGGISRDNWCSPVSLLNVSQAGLELTSGGTGALLFSQCTVVWGSFVWAMGSGCQSFDSFWCFISAKCGSSVSAGFLIFFFFF
jgi:hypothetical protein